MIPVLFEVHKSTIIIALNSYESQLNYCMNEQTFHFLRDKPVCNSVQVANSITL